MNKALLKTYAPQARREFISAISARANLLGISDAGISAAQRSGDVAIIEGREWPTKLAELRDRLVARIKRNGYAQTMEAVAYSWFNRFVALRYMEIHDFLGHGHRVLSSRFGGQPEILSHAIELDLPGLNKDHIKEKQLAGNQDSELYRMILISQCNDLSRSMPFLFERIDDDTELLLPDNLLRTDSVIVKLVDAIPEENWQQVEIIGWLYQFYISEKKDDVIGKVVKSEDIPAATQLFTPNWIVQYLVQNSIGRLWMMSNPASTLKAHWPYYLAPAEQTPEVQAQLDALIQSRAAEDGGSLNPETITVLDPACGSGHILVVAYDVLKAIYLERGYQPRAIPRLILEKNLYGLDIDDRAAQLAGFALLMKARADDRRLLDDPPKLNVLSLQESRGLELDEIAAHLQPFGVNRTLLKELLDTFAHSKTFGSLIRLPEELNTKLVRLGESVEGAVQGGDLYVRATAQELLPLVAQAKVLAMRFDAVVANPPYMGKKYYVAELKNFVKKFYEEGQQDLYGCFLQRSIEFAKSSAYIANINIPNWMFITTFEKLRSYVLGNTHISSLVHNGRGVFGSDFGTVAFVLCKGGIRNYCGTFKRLFEEYGSVSSSEELERAFFGNKEYLIPDAVFQRIPGQPIAYWISPALVSIFDSGSSITQLVDPRQGLATSDNTKFLRLWHEVDIGKVGFSCSDTADSVVSKKKWFPCNKGGNFRKWYGNMEFFVNWENNGKAVKELIVEKYPYLNGNPNFVAKNPDFYFRESLSWSDVTISDNAFRFYPKGFIFDVSGHSAFSVDRKILLGVLGFLNSAVAGRLIKFLNPTVHFNVGNFKQLPCPKKDAVNAAHVGVEKAILIARDDWNCFENSWEFERLPFLFDELKGGSLAVTWDAWSKLSSQRVIELKQIEESNNHLFIEAYGLQDEISPVVPEDQITLARADREKDCQRIISYAIGCMMGRYSLDEPGLIYAHYGNVGFDLGRYNTFHADADGIVPVTDELWFEDDAASRIREFLLAIWGEKTLNENIIWLAEGLGAKGNETPEESIRRYLADKFYKDHLQTYKKRPIYWRFSSGKQKAFEALVYVHRYNEGTLARMRNECVVPLTSKFASRIEMLQADVASAGAVAARAKVQKKMDVLRKKQAELLSFDEKLRHFADMRIKLNLDDGVKVNYAKFGDLLAESKAICGASDD